MSRGRFRARVEEARPASAWVLVTVASATLWITNQLGSATVAAQVAMLLFSLWRRQAPFGWQQSPIALNVGMFGVVWVTVSLALDGEPSTISLAHFAALTQGLQLMDSRPRQTEFLLVTLALFQVILASNLTDSVFFPPLLVGFVCAAVWTMLVHTLRTEALEAGDPQGVERALTPGLLRMTLIASALSVLLALVLFVSLPRLRSSVVRGSSLGAALAAAGFSDRVELGEIGRIRQDNTIMLRVETLVGPEPSPTTGYWRGVAFDYFDGRSWSITPSLRHTVPGTVEIGLQFGRSDEPAPSLVQRIVREPVEGGVLFSAGRTREIQGTVRHLERDSSGGLYAANQAGERIRYTVGTRLPQVTDADLADDRAAPDLRHPLRDLQLPELTPRVAEFARSIVDGTETDVERVRRIERHLIQNGRYTDTPPVIDDVSGESPVETFLFGGMAGHCEYFASSMVILLRSIRVPARIVNGFAGGRLNEIGDFFEVTRSNAHTWVEVHYSEAGWVRYDPTPPDLRLAAVPAASFGDQARQLASALELWWFQRVVGFDRSDQIHAIQRAWTAWRKTREQRHDANAQRARRPWADAWRDDLLAVVPWLLVGAVALAALSWRRRAGPRHARVPREYERALRLLRRRGLVRGATTPAREFVHMVRAEVPVAASVAFDALTESYLAERFGGRPPHLQSMRQLAELRDGLRARNTGRD